MKRAERDLRETVWRSYKNVFLLAEDNTFRRIDLGLVHSSAAASMVELIVARLKQEALVSEGVSPNFLTRYWPLALAEWSTKSVRDAFFAAYVGKSASGAYEPFIYRRSLTGNDVEISEDVFLISRDAAEAYLKAQEAGASPEPTTASTPGSAAIGADSIAPVPPATTAATTTTTGVTAGTLPGFRWSGVLG